MEQEEQHLFHFPLDECASQSSRDIYIFRSSQLLY